MATLLQLCGSTPDVVVEELSAAEQPFRSTSLFSDTKSTTVRDAENSLGVFDRSYGLINGMISLLNYL